MIAIKNFAGILFQFHLQINAFDNSLDFVQRLKSCAHIFKF